MSASGLAYGQYVDASGQSYGFVYNNANQSFTNITGPTGSLETSVEGVTASGLAFGWYTDASNISHGLLFNTTNQTYINLVDPSGANIASVDGVSAGGFAYGMSINASGDPQGFVYNIATKTFTDVIDPAGVLGTQIQGVTASGLVYGDYLDAQSNPHPFVFDPASGAFSAPGGADGVLIGQSAYLPVAVSANALYWNTGSQTNSQGLLYTPGSNVLTVGQSAAFQIDVNEAVTVSANAYLTLNNGGTAVFDAKNLTLTSLVFVYTVAPGGNFNTSDLKVTGLGGTTHFEADNFLNTSNLVEDTHLQVNAGTPQVVGATVDAGSDVSINYPGATGTQIIGVNAAGVVFGYYYNVLGSTTTQNAFAYDPTTNGWANIAPPSGGTNLTIDGVGVSGVAYGSYTTAAGVEDGFVYDAASATFTDIPPPVVGGSLPVPSGPGIGPGPGVDSTLNISGVTASGEAYGVYTVSSSGEPAQYGFVYNTTTGASTTIDLSLIGGAGPSSILGVALSGVTASGVAYGDYYSEAGGETHAFFYDTNSDAFLTPGIPDVNGSQIVGATASGLLYGNYYDANWVEHSFLYDSGAGTYTPIDDSAAGSGSPGGTQITGVSASGLAYGQYVDASGQSYGFVYNNANQSFTNITGPTGSLETSVEGVTASGLAFGWYTDASNISHGLLFNTTNQTYINLVDPSGANIASVDGVSAGGLAYGMSINASGDPQGFV